MESKKMLKIHLKVFDRREMFGNIEHSEVSNPLEYVLPCIGEKWEISGEKNADLIFCSIYTVGYNDFEEWVKNVKNKKIIVGGYHPSLCPEDFEMFDLTLIKGAGESVINEAISSEGKIFAGEPRDVVPYRLSYSKIVRHKEKIMNIRTYVGCDRKCFYCCHPIVYPRPYNFSLEKIIMDITVHGPDSVFVTDSNFLRSEIFEGLSEYCSKQNIGMRFYATAEDLEYRHVEKINRLPSSEIIVGLEKNISEEKERLLGELNSKKIGCIIKTTNNRKMVEEIKKRFFWIDYFSEMWLMPFPKTNCGKKFPVSKEDYHLLNPRDAEVFRAE